MSRVWIVECEIELSRDGWTKRKQKLLDNVNVCGCVCVRLVWMRLEARYRFESDAAAAAACKMPHHRGHIVLMLK